MARLKVAVLISGRGSNLQALIDAFREADFPAEIVLVISNVPDAGGLERARRAGIAAQVIDHRKFQGRAPFEDALDAALRAAGAEHWALESPQEKIPRDEEDNAQDLFAIETSTSAMDDSRSCVVPVTSSKHVPQQEHCVEEHAGRHAFDHGPRGGP